MKTFIKVTEIWVPNMERTHLELNKGIYGDFKAFKVISEQKKFAYRQGLPGAVWAAGHPVVITEFENSYFERTEAAHQAGLTCAIGIPVMAGEFLMAVIVFLCGDDEDHAGAIEVWANDPDRRNELGVIDGYYGTLGYFEFISRQTKLMKGFGLPGLVWEKGMPVLMEHLDNSANFIRGRDAKNAGITTGIGIPVVMDQDQIYIITFLSAKMTPIAKGLQIWVPDEAHQKLVCQKAFNALSDELTDMFESKTFVKGESFIGQAWLSGVPVIGESALSGQLADPAAISALLAMPVIDKGILKAVVTFLF